MYSDFKGSQYLLLSMHLSIFFVIYIIFVICIILLFYNKIYYYFVIFLLCGIRISLSTNTLFEEYWTSGVAAQSLLSIQASLLRHN